MPKSGSILDPVKRMGAVVRVCGRLPTRSWSGPPAAAGTATNRRRRVYRGMAAELAAVGDRSSAAR